VKVRTLLAFRSFHLLSSNQTILAGGNFGGYILPGTESHLPSSTSLAKPKKIHPRRIASSAWVNFFYRLSSTGYHRESIDTPFSYQLVTLS
jgi:hypothetical protein